MNIRYNCIYYCSKYIIEVQFRDHYPYKISNIKYRDSKDIDIKNKTIIKESYNDLKKLLFTYEIFEKSQKIKKDVNKIKKLIKKLIKNN